MESNENVWADWLEQENEYAVGDRKAMEAGGGKYLNFIKIVMRKKNCRRNNCVCGAGGGHYSAGRKGPVKKPF